MLLAFPPSTHWVEPTCGHGCPLLAEPLPTTSAHLIGDLYCSHVQLGAVWGGAVLIPGPHSV